MEEAIKKITPTDTTKMMDDLNKILYLFTFKDFWIEDVKFSKSFVKIYDVFHRVLNVMQGIICALQLGAHFTQKHLNAQQKMNSLVMGIGQPLVLLCCLNCRYYKKEFRQIFYNLFVVLKEKYNDQETEKVMIKKLKFFLMLYWVCSFISVFLSGTYALMQTVMTGATFVTVVTAWPDVTDPSTLASCARVCFFIFWSFHSFTTSVVFIVVLLVFLGLTYQYRNLQKYFESLNRIFESEQLSHREMEVDFEKALQKGIQMHSDTLWCVNQSQIVCSGINAGMILLTTGVLIILMPAILNSKDDLLGASIYFVILALILTVMAFFMCNAGDTTVEAQKLPDAIYSSGWYNCYGKSSARIRSLVVTAMIQAQEPVVFTGFGVVTLSYENFEAIIKSAYSVFSVFY